MIIYQITNKVNNKTYIGKTTKTLKHRFMKHCSSANGGSNTYLHKAMRKYGFNSFIITPLEEKVKDLNEAEIKYISELNPDYNMTSGGDGGDTSNSPNFKKSVEAYHKNKSRDSYATYGMLGKTHPQKGKSLVKNKCPVVCDGIEFDSVGEAQKHFKGISVRKRLDSERHPNFYRLKPKRLYQTTE